jgi:hypothetical protein
VDVWRSFDRARRHLSDAWVDDVAPPRGTVEGIVEEARIDVTRRLRRALLHRRRWFRPRAKPLRPRFMTDAQPDPRRL